MYLVMMNRNLREPLLQHREYDRNGSSSNSCNDTSKLILLALGYVANALIVSVLFAQNFDVFQQLYTVTIKCASQSSESEDFLDQVVRKANIMGVAFGVGSLYNNLVLVTC